jgi:hypothetical protein
MTSIPIAEAPAFRGIARRTAIVRVLLAAAILGTALATAVSASRLEVRTTPLFGSGSSGILVLDLSSSIDSVPRREIGTVLRRLADARSHVGLVLFSDVAYEALPASASSEELRTYLRFFPAPPSARTGRPLPIRRVRVVTPWTRSFRGGTRISAGLQLARRMIAEHPRRTNDVVLVSDLNDSLFDVSALSTALDELRRDRIHLRVVAMNANRANRAFFSRRLGQAALIRAPELFAWRQRKPTGHTPRGLITAVVALALLLAVNELQCRRLDWRRG